MQFLRKLLGCFNAKPNTAEQYILSNEPKNIGDVERLQRQFERANNLHAPHRGLL
tara:strand:+ start:891 stop:1055 length:165 start_codon:yes stop_codon:yes gene_type:complete